MNALITGAGRGLGLALTHRFAAREGAHVFAAAREPEASMELKAAANSSDGRVSVIAADVARDDVGRVLARAVGSARLDLVINNAGAMDEHDLGELTQADLIEHFKVNVFGPVLVVEGLLPSLAPNAKIVNVTSILGSIERGGGGYVAYGMGKAALNMFTRKLASELDGVSVLALHPGWVRTRMGGPNAAISIDTSADGMVRVIDALDATTSGSFLAYDGSRIPW